MSLNLFKEARRKHLFEQALDYIRQLDEVREFVTADNPPKLQEWAKLYTQAYICKLRTMR